jgi:hypothetical protein
MIFQSIDEIDQFVKGSTQFVNRLRRCCGGPPQHAAGPDATPRHVVPAGVGGGSHLRALASLPAVGGGGTTLGRGGGLRAEKRLVPRGSWLLTREGETRSATGD